MLEVIRAVSLEAALIIWWKLRKDRHHFLSGDKGAADGFSGGKLFFGYI